MLDKYKFFPNERNPSRFGIQIINVRTMTFRVWNYEQLDPEWGNLSIWEIFRNIQYATGELNN